MDASTSISRSAEIQPLTPDLTKFQQLKGHNHGSTTLVLPPAGVIFRIDSVRQLARAAGKRFVCTLPFCVAGNESLSARVKVWFNRMRELRLSLLISRKITSQDSSNEDFSSIASPTDLLFSGQVYNKRRDVFHNLWTCDVRITFKTVFQIMQCDDAGFSEVTLDEEIFPLMTGSIGLDHLHSGMQSSLLPNVGRDSISVSENKTVSGISLEDLMTQGLVTDNSLTLKWDLKSR